MESLDVRVTNRGGKSGTRAGGFTYFASFIENWVFIEKDTPDLQGINFNPVDSAAEPVLVSFDNALWAFWHETVGGTNTIFAAKFNGDIENPAWPLQDDDTPGWNANSALDAESPQAVVHEDRLYLMWLENNRVRVARYDASNPSLRVFIDAGGLNDSGKPAVHPRITVYDGRLYAAWTQLESGAYQVRLAKFDETSWSFVSGHEDALNLFPSGSADSPDLVVLGADLYITWSESDGSRYRGLIKKYNATTGLFTSVASYADEWSTDALSPRLAVWEGELYVTWLQQEDTSPYRGSWVAKLNGSSWTLYNHSGTTEGFNSGPANALQPRLLSTYGKLYLTLAEDTGSLHVYQWDGTLWAPAYDTSSGGIQWNGGGLDSRDLSLATFEGRIYASWSQLDSTTNRQIRIAVGMPSP